MANYVLTTTAQEVGRNTAPVVGARLLAWYSNPTSTGATVHLKLQAISQGGTYTGTNKDYELTLDSTATGVISWSYAPLPANTWVDVREITQTITFGRTVNVSGKVWTYLHGDAWVSGNTVTLQSSATPPTGLAVSDIVPGVDFFTGTVSITSWGNGGTVADRYLELQCWTYDASSLAQPRRYRTDHTSNLSATITVDNEASYSTAYGPLTIRPNTRYTIGAYASNGAANTGSIRIGDYVTLAAPAEVSIASHTPTSATLTYSVSTDGGFYSSTLEYSIDGDSTWIPITTISGGSGASGTFTISGLTPGDVYTVLTRSTTTAGFSYGTTVTLNMQSSPTFYGSANNQAQRADTLYGSVNNQATRITKLYGSVGGITKRIF